MKKLLIMIKIMFVCFIGLIMISGCDFSADSVDPVNPQNPSEPGVIDQEPSKNNLGDYNVELLNATLTKDYIGTPVIIIHYIFTNNSDEVVSPVVALDIQAFQGVVSLNQAYIVDDYDPSNDNVDLRPGGSYEFCIAFELIDTSTDVEIEVIEWLSDVFGDPDYKVTKTYTFTD